APARVGSPTGVQHVLDTVSGGANLAKIATTIELLDGAATPGNHLRLTTPGGTDVPHTRVTLVTTPSSGRIRLVYKMELDATEGGRVCLHLDTDESQSTDYSDATTTGGGAGWQFLFAGTTTDLSGNGRTLSATG